MKDNFVTLKSLSSEMEAEILNGKLRAFGIESFISKDDCGGMDPTMHMVFGVQLKVREDDLKEAQSIIGETDSPRRITAKESSSSLATFWIIMLLAMGTGLILAGNSYYQGFTKYGAALVTIGVALWLRLRFRLKKRT